MKKKHSAQSAFLSLCISLGVLVFFGRILVALFASVSPETSTQEDARKIDAQAQSPDRTNRLRPVAYPRHGLPATMEPVTAMTKPNLLLLTIQAMSTWQERSGARKHSMITPRSSMTWSVSKLNAVS
jgi:hypothetical protein